jgi:hypothetical protein
MIGLLDKAGADWIALHIAHGGPHVRFVESAREETVLPEVAVAAERGVHVLGEASVKDAEGASQILGRRWHYNPMNMIGH